MRNSWSGHTFPHPSGRRPFVGDVLSMDRRKPVQRLIELSAERHPMFEFQLFDQKIVLATGAEVAAELCDEARFEKGLAPAVSALRELVGDGLFTALNDEPNWRTAHDLLQPAFSRSAMQRYHATMLTVVDEMVTYCERQPGSVDVAELMTKLTLETITRAAFSRDFGSFTRSDVHPFVPAMVTGLKAGRQMGALSAMPGGGLLPWIVRRRYSGELDYVAKLVDDLIASRRASGDSSTRDLLGIMLSEAEPTSGRRLDDVNIRHQILTFLVAGHETTSGALSFALYYLSQNPAVLDRAKAEVDEILGESSEPTFEQIPKFRYLRRVLDEALRLWPTVPAFARSPRQDTVLNGRWPMRRDDFALVFLPAVHRDPAVWGDDADTFDPDRFTPERVHARPAHSYKPFGTGERACIGRQFALHEAILVLASLIHRYDFAADPNYELRIQERLTLMPEDFRLTLSTRARSVSEAVR